MCGTRIGVCVRDTVVRNGSVKFDRGQDNDGKSFDDTLAVIIFAISEDLILSFCEHLPAVQLNKTAL